MNLRDLRLWRPDETCEPWGWETSVSLAGGSMGTFRVPSDNLAVLTSYMITTNSQIAKETARWNIVPENPNAIPLRLSGALTEVTELSSTGANLPGLALMVNSGARPIRLAIPGGQLYHVVQTGNAGGIVGIALFGYSFRYHP